MAHHTIKSGYRRLSERLNRFPQGAPPTALLFQILKMLFSESEAHLVAQLPIKPFTVEKAAKIWNMKPMEAKKILDELSSRAILLDMESNGRQVYILPPPMAGFFEFSMMRFRGDIDQKLLGELFYQYLNVEEDFIKDLLLHGETQLGRVFVQERVLSSENALHVMDYERASEVIKGAKHIGIGICYCRHKMQHVGKACNAPMEICMTFHGTAASLIKHGYAKPVDEVEGLRLLEKAWEHNLVQFGENVREKVNFICNCCSCCCEAMIAAKKFGVLQPIHTTNFLPVVNVDQCKGCGKCVAVCPVEAATIVKNNDLQNTIHRKVKIDESICLGCGLCLRNCPVKALSLQSRNQRIITPVNSTHRAVLMAIERGKLHHLIFDNKAYMSHRAMAAILGVILRLPPVKQAMASQQMKSHYLDRLIGRLCRN
ncbi:(Fe-S)-binding protein [Geosporobacter ferrireducens]|uniref:(Fe-S)-binding protein n=2 Tax=Geosporobacter ferrireducens TaxID=1424294 RepID=A0A1D8GQF9_9FIRM|nr:4Fe-4S binding protein [Geosporobacter ferrireducens]AOT73181.1 (Fe-S)-binding protein [Geosporobacter ferrireducens]MTI57916.1 4Fe-4S dicluster domain-containing protein [Geosporobacter ferrireducens]